MENLTFNRDLVDWSRLTNSPAYIAFLDFEKAFDRVSWRYRDAVLRWLGFPESFITMVNALYNEASVRLIINGKLGERITQTRGVRQGCPLSPFIFALFVEPLGELLRAQAHELGLPLPALKDDHSTLEQFILGSQFADDTTIYSNQPHKLLLVLQLIQSDFVLHLAPSLM